MHGSLHVCMTTAVHLFDPLPAMVISQAALLTLNQLMMEGDWKKFYSGLSLNFSLLDIANSVTVTWKYEECQTWHVVIIFFFHGSFQNSQHVCMDEVSSRNQP